MDLRQAPIHDHHGKLKPEPLCQFLHVHREIGKLKAGNLHNGSAAPGFINGGIRMSGLNWWTILASPAMKNFLYGCFIIPIFYAWLLIKTNKICTLTRRQAYRDLRRRFVGRNGHITDKPSKSLCSLASYDRPSDTQSTGPVVVRILITV
jgi:hypothetical protein